MESKGERKEGKESLTKQVSTRRCHSWYEHKTPEDHERKKGDGREREEG
jgi:hypothetical protein